MAKASINSYFEKYKKAREELMTKVGRYALAGTDVETLKEFKEKYVVLSREDEDVALLLLEREEKEKKAKAESEHEVNLDTLN